MLNELILGYYVFYECPVCGRPHRGENLEYWWCPYCGSNVKQQIKDLEKRIDILEEKLEKLEENNNIEE